MNPCPDCGFADEKRERLALLEEQNTAWTTRRLGQKPAPEEREELLTLLGQRAGWLRCPNSPHAALPPDVSLGPDEVAVNPGDEPVPQDLEQRVLSISEEDVQAALGFPVSALSEEDQADIAAAHEALSSGKTVPWEQVKQELEVEWAKAPAPVDVRQASPELLAYLGIELIEETPETPVQTEDSAISPSVQAPEGPPEAPKEDANLVAA